LALAVGLLALGVLGLVLAAAVTLPGLRGQLEQGRDALSRAEAALRAGDVDEAAALVRRAGDDLRQAESTVRLPQYRMLGRLPVTRAPVRELQATTRALGVTAREVLPPLLTAARYPGQLTQRLDPAPFRAARQPLAEAADTLDLVRAALAAAPRSGLGPVSDARAELGERLTRLASSVTEAQAAAALVPHLATGRREVFLVVQNNAEQRATGGLIGAYGVLTVDDGAVRLTRIGPNGDLKDPDKPVVSLGADYDARYGRFESTRTWRSANLSPDVPTAGRLLNALYADRLGRPADAVLFLDPFALAELLRATGPVTLTDGSRLTAQNAAEELLVNVYGRYSRAQDAERNQALQETARRVFGKLFAGGVSTRAVARSVAAAVGTGHMALYVEDASVQQMVARSRAGGVLRADGPFLSLVTQDVGGSKLGSYLERSVRYEASPTGAAVDLGDGVTLSNSAPARLPAYVTLRPDDARAPPGQTKQWVSVYLGRGSTLLGATVDGKPLPMESHVEKGLSVFSTFLTIDRGQSRTLLLTIRQPASPGEPLTYRQQPLQRPDDVTIERSGAPVRWTYER
jgi:hypothetical protein